jgi:hypothetical protein
VFAAEQGSNEVRDAGARTVGRIEVAMLEQLTLDGEAHAVIGITIHDRRSYFALSFQIEGGRTLQLRCPADQLLSLGKRLIELAEERRLHGDV